MFSRYGDELDADLRSSIPTHDSNLYVIHRYSQGWVKNTGEPVYNASPGGKRIRPTICLFVCDSLNGDWMRAVPAASSIELAHAFSLIHDDIQDQDNERHHRETAWCIWGVPKALVAGNAMRSLGDLATQRLICNGYSNQTAFQATSLIASSCLEIIEGQCLDLSFESHLNITTSEYIKMIKLKTGSLIRCSMELGAVLAVADKNTTNIFRQCGEYLGKAFQIRDDILGTWGTPTITGKPSGNDIRQKKKSYPVIYAFENTSPIGHNELSKIYKKQHISQVDVQKVLGILDDTNAFNSANALVDQSAHLALQTIKTTGITQQAITEFSLLADFLISRDF